MSPLAPSTPPVAPRSRGSALSRWGRVLAALLMLAGGLVVWLSYKFTSEAGTQVTVTFKEAHGLRPAAPVRSHGVEVGKVTEVRLSDDQQGAIVQLTLRPSAAGLARSGTQWWIVRPTVSLGRQGVGGLDTALGEKYIGVQPGEGEPTRQFTGAEEPPLPQPDGCLTVVLRTNQRPDPLRMGAPVRFRNCPIGWVQSVKLADNGSHVRAILLIEREYRQHVRADVVFRPVTTTLVKGNVITGFSSRLSPESLAGGVEMEPSKTSGPPVKSGHAFDLEEQ